MRHVDRSADEQRLVSSRIVLILTGGLVDGDWYSKYPSRGKGIQSVLAVEMIDQVERRFNNLHIKLSRKREE
jgi:hypothetical protein